MKVEWSGQEDLSDKKEQAFKVVLIISLCVSILSCTCLCTVFPLLYQYMRLSDSQYGNVLDFCEYTADTVLFDTGELLDTHAGLPAWHQNSNQTVWFSLLVLTLSSLEIQKTSSTRSMQVWVTPGSFRIARSTRACLVVSRDYHGFRMKGAPGRNGLFVCRTAQKRSNFRSLWSSSTSALRTATRFKEVLSRKVSSRFTGR